MIAFVFPGQGSQIIGMLDNLITIDKKAREIVNRVKNRETYRPFGASVLKEDAHRYLKNPID